MDGFLVMEGRIAQFIDPASTLQTRHFMEMLTDFAARQGWTGAHDELSFA